MRSETSVYNSGENVSEEIHVVPWEGVNVIVTDVFKYYFLFSCHELYRVL